MNRLPPQTGSGFLLRAGQHLAVLDPTGGQVGDLFCVSAKDHDEWLSSGRTIDYANTIYVTTGHQLYSNRSRPMLTIVEDTCGRHDFVLTPGRYVGAEEAEDDGEPIEDKLARLRGRLYEEFEEADRLEKLIRQRLEGLIG